MSAKATSYVPWAIGYAIFLAAVVWGVVQWRATSLAELETPEVTKEWNEFRETLKSEAANNAPSRHKISKREVPSLVVMLRERFPAVLGGAIVFATLFYGMAMFLIRGLRATPAWQPPADAQETSR